MDVGISLREFIEVRLASIERELTNLRSAIEKLATNATVTDLCDQVADQGQRVVRLEADVRVLRWVGGAVATVVIGLVVAWLKQALGL